MDSSSLRRRLSRLSPSAQAQLQSVMGMDTYSSKKKGGFMRYLLIFLVTAIIAYIVLYTWNPSFLRQVVDDKVTDVVDPMKTLGASVVIGLLADLIAWLMNRNK
jgi:hypothetical protein